MTIDPPAGIPGFHKAPCLGCGTDVLEVARHFTVAATGDGAWFIVTPSMPGGIARASDPNGPPVGSPVYVVGVAHEACDRAAVEAIHRPGFVIGTDLPAATINYPDQN